MRDTLLAFWRAVAENPADQAPRLIFCDWLQEQAEAGTNRRTLEVIRSGQLWQVKNGKWPQAVRLHLLPSVRCGWCWWHGPGSRDEAVGTIPKNARLPELPFFDWTSPPPGSLIRSEAKEWHLYT